MTLGFCSTLKNSHSQTIQTLHRNSSVYKKRFSWKKYSQWSFYLRDLSNQSLRRGGMIKLKLVQFWIKFSTLNLYSTNWLLLKWAWKNWVVFYFSLHVSLLFFLWVWLMSKFLTCAIPNEIQHFNFLQYALTTIKMSVNKYSEVLCFLCMFLCFFFWGGGDCLS